MTQGMCFPNVFPPFKSTSLVDITFGLPVIKCSDARVLHQWALNNLSVA